MITRYEINERMAHVANDINSFSTYKEGTATADYEAVILRLEDTLKRIQEKRPANYDKAVYMAERFSKKYAEYLNAYYRNEAACPSVLVCGAGNFPVKKKQKQNSRRDTLLQEYNYLMEYKRKIEALETYEAPIKSSDADAIERLEDKLKDLEDLQEQMKRINAYYRKNNTCVGCDDLTEEQAIRIDDFLKSGRSWYGVPHPTFQLSNNLAEIKRVKARIDELKAVKEAGTSETEYSGFSVVENVELMRLQIIFDSKPDEETRNILKSNGFKWSPSQNAWQRQLTDNARYALKRVLKEIA